MVLAHSSAWVPTLRPRTLLIAALSVHVVLGAVAAVRSSRPLADFDRYYEIATGTGRPYVDYQVEHPIGTLFLFKVLASAAQGRTSFGRGLVAMSLLADAVIIAALLWGWGEVAAAYFAVVVIPVIGLLFNRIDLWSTAAATVAFASWQRDQRVLTAAALALGGALKLWPLLLAPLLLVPGSTSRRRWPGFLVFTLAAGTLAGITWLIAGWRGGVDVLTFRGARGWQIESVVGSLVHLAGAESLRMDGGSWRIGATTGTVSVLMFVLAVPLCLWSVWRGARTAHLGAGWLAGVSALLLLSALFSPQFVGWLAPGAAVAWTEGDRRPALMAGVTIALTEIFWNWYDAVLSGATAALVAVVVRNLAVAALLVLTLRTLARASVVEADLQPDLAAVGVVEGAEGG